MANNKFIEQAKSFLEKLSTAQKVTIGVAVAAAITGMTLLILHTSKPSMGLLYADLEQKDAATIVDKLKEQGITYELTNNGSTIMVSSDKVHETRLTLAKDGFVPNSVVGYEIFDKTNLGMSDFVQKLNYKRAIEGELQKTISTFDECQKVRVMIVMPEKTLFEKDQKKSTAAVHIHLKNGRSLSKLNIEGIQNLVASSIEGMAAADVAVVDQKGTMLSDLKRESNGTSGLTSSQHEQQQKVDEYMNKKVQSLLDGVLGANKAIVRVNSELDFTQVERTKENFDPDGQVVLSEEKINEARKSKDSIDYPSVNNESNVGHTKSNYLNSKVIEHIVNAVGTVKRVSVSVMVDGTTKVADLNGEKKLQYTPRSDDEMQKITQIVRNAVGFDPQRNDQVSVVNMPFDQTALEEDLKTPTSILNMTPQELIEKMLLVVAMIIAVFMVRKLFASPQLQRQIEEIFAPPMEELAAHSPYAAQLGYAAPAGYAVSPGGQLTALGSGKHNVQMLEENNSITRDELVARARARLDSSTQSNMNEDQIINDEMRHRIQLFFDNHESEALKIVKLMMNKSIK